MWPNRQSFFKLKLGGLNVFGSVLKPLEEARGGASDRVLQNSSDSVSSHYESYIYTARSRTEVSRDVLLVWVALMNTAQHLSLANHGGVKSPSKS